MQINQRLICFEDLRRKAREDGAEVRAVERGVFVDLAREEGLTQAATSCAGVANAMIG